MTFMSRRTLVAIFLLVGVALPSAILAQGSPPASTGTTLFENVRSEGLKLWFLVTYPLQLEDRLVVLREVSQPEPTPQNQIIERWAHRIPLPPMEFPQRRTPNVDGPEEVDFPIALRR